MNSFDDLRKDLGDECLAKASEEIARGEAAGLTLLPFWAPQYPAGLRDLPEPPASIWLRGVMQEAPRIALVGSRSCSKEGATFAKSLAVNLTAEGISVVSGLARGIDAAAHQGAVFACRELARKSGAAGAGVAVLGSGLCKLYPSENARLAEELVDHGGCVLSEYRLDQCPHPLLFPDRNRLISALASSVVVVEARAKSGSLITARLAEELGRELFTVPASTVVAHGRGSNELIRLGARVLLSPAEIDELLPIGWKRKALFGSENRGNDVLSLAALFASAVERDCALQMLKFCSGVERNIDEMVDVLQRDTPLLLRVATRLELAELLVRGGASGWLAAFSQEFLRR